VLLLLLCLPQLVVVLVPVTLQQTPALGVVGCCAVLPPQLHQPCCHLLQPGCHLLQPA
jgi:hypothetical protein